LSKFSCIAFSNDTDDFSLPVFVKKEKPAFGGLTSHLDLLLLLLADVLMSFRFLLGNRRMPDMFPMCGIQARGLLLLRCRFFFPGMIHWSLS
jgi:hypothetical protein